MIAIKDMGMPKCCYECRFEVLLDDEERKWLKKYAYCYAAQMFIDAYSCKPDWCPLEEVKNGSN